MSECNRLQLSDAYCQYVETEIFTREPHPLPNHREIIRREALPTLLQLLRMGPPIIHQPAYEILRELSGVDFGPSDYTAWEGWVHTELAENEP